jgi:hypothetical protein
MGDNSVEQSWYIFWRIKALISLCFLGAVTLICTSVFELIRSKRAKRRSLKQSIVRSVSTPRSYRNFDASEPVAVNPCSNNPKTRVGMPNSASRKRETTNTKA